VRLGNRPGTESRAGRRAVAGRLRGGRTTVAGPGRRTRRTAHTGDAPHDGQRRAVDRHCAASRHRRRERHGGAGRQRGGRGAGRGVGGFPAHPRQGSHRFHPRPGGPLGCRRRAAPLRTADPNYRGAGGPGGGQRSAGLPEQLHRRRPEARGHGAARSRPRRTACGVSDPRRGAEHCPAY
jgi:hypothetical protein